MFLYIHGCRRPTTLHDRTRDSDDADYQDRDFDVATLANNLSQVFRYGVSNNGDTDEVLYVTSKLFHLFVIYNFIHACICYGTRKTFVRSINDW